MAGVFRLDLGGRPQRVDLIVSDDESAQSTWRDKVLSLSVLENGGHQVGRGLERLPGTIGSDYHISACGTGQALPFRIQNR